MTLVGITGAGGFIGTNLRVALERIQAFEVRSIRRDAGPLGEQLRGIDVLVHLAGVNRVAEEREFLEGNVEYTRSLCQALDATETAPHVLFASSIQAAGDSIYGRSKRAAEGVLTEWAHAERSGKRPSVTLYRLSNAFGKWGRPRYNSVVATFAYAIARGEPYEVHDPDKRLELVYVDDIVSELIRECAAPHEPGSVRSGSAGPLYATTVGDIARTFERFAESRKTNYLPSFDDPLTFKLYATYVGSLPSEALTYSLNERSDQRGKLAEVIKSPQAGQIFVSVTHPGKVRGNHFHDSKAEKFMVLSGTAAIDMKHVPSGSTWRITSTGERWEMIDIPPGTAHRITNVGSDELLMLFWSSEPFDQNRPDTHPAKVADA